MFGTPMQSWPCVAGQAQYTYAAVDSLSLKGRRKKWKDDSLGFEQSFNEFKEKYVSGNIDIGERCNVIVTRKKVLKSVYDAIKQPSFDWHKPLFVEFIGEQGDDYGGPTREFFRLLMQEVASSGIFEGRSSSVTFTYDVQKLEKGIYRTAGNLACWSLAHGGPGLPFLNKNTYLMMCGVPVVCNDADAVPDVDIRNNILKIQSCQESDWYNMVMELNDWAFDQGCNLVRGAFGQKDVIVDQLIKHQIFYKSKAAIDQFVDGAGELWKLVVDYTDESQDMFVHSSSKLTRQKFKELLSIEWSPEHSNRRDKEEETIYCWELFLKLCEEGRSSVTFGDILAFCTGADNIPPTGFMKKISVTFHDQSNGPMPLSHTCSMEIVLPIGFADQDGFKDIMETAIIGSYGFFGKV